MTSKTQPTWNDVRQIADEIELKIHLAGMDARDRWRDLKPRMVELETTIERAGKRVSEVISDQLASLGTTMRRLRDDVVRDVSGSKSDA